MQKVKLSFLFLILLKSLACFSQSYVDYQIKFNKIDDFVLSNRLDSAMHIADQIHASYDFIFAKHCFKILQICAVKQDSLQAEKWLKKCFLSGIQSWYLLNNDLTKQVFNFSPCKRVLEKEDSLYSVYRARLDTNLANEMHKMILEDQRLTDRVNRGVSFRFLFDYIKWRRNNTRQFKILQKIIIEKGFPGERLIGLSENHKDTAVMHKLYLNGNGYNFGQFYARTMLLHCFSNPRPDIRTWLKKEVENGNLPADHYASFCDFYASYGRRKYRFQHFNFWTKDKNPAHLPEIEQRRRGIGLNTIDEQERNQSIRHARFKSKTLHSTIILE